MSRNWLPPMPDLAAALAESQDAETATRWKRLRTLAGHDLDFASVARLDRVARKLRTAAGDPASFQPLKLAILSTSTAGHLLPGIRVGALARGLIVDIYEPDYGQVRQELMRGSGLDAYAPQAVLFANDPYSLFGSGAVGQLTDADAAEQRVRAEVETLRGQWRIARDRWGAAVLQQLPFNPFLRLAGENEHRLPGGRVSLMRRFQQALRVAADEERIDLIDLDAWSTRDGLSFWHSPALWHRSKQEVHPAAAPLYGDLVARVIAARFGRAAKCLVLDLDNTVWGGVIGDDGLPGIVIGQGSAIGEGHLAFQHYAKQLAERGIILAVCSKNDDPVAREPFTSHPEMLLKLKDISCFVANWTDKATNLRRIATELNIGLDALVFADDNPFERALVRAELPEVFVPELGEDVADYPILIADSGYFEAVAITADDLGKTEQYQLNAQRQVLMSETTDLEGYLAALDMKMIHRPFDEIGLARIVQLINKTNQFNLTTRRYTEAEVRRLLDDPNAFTRQIRLTDKFGDNGIISILIGRKDSATRTLDIETWLMSCRVLGRQVEQATLDMIVAAARAAGIERLVGEYIPTERNGMVKDHYAGLGFAQLDRDDGRSRWMLTLAGYDAKSTHIQTEAA